MKIFLLRDFVFKHATIFLEITRDGYLTERWMFVPGYTVGGTKQNTMR